MGMTNRGWTNKGGERAVMNPFCDNGIKSTIPITVDNAYNRGRIPAFSLWAPSDQSSNPWKYMPYIPPINIVASDDATYYDIPNEWHDYFRGGDEVIALDVSEVATNLKFFGKQGVANDTDITTCVLGTSSATVASIGALDSGGTGYTRITMTDMLDTDTKPAEGAIGTGDVLVLAGSSTSTAILSYQEADTVVIMEQAFDFADAVRGGAAGTGGYLVESAVYSYTGRIDQNFIEYYTYLNTGDASPALTTCGRFVNGTRFNFASIYRG